MSRDAMDRSPPDIMVDQLRTVLELERRQGFGDTAVQGGLDAFLRSWALQAHQVVRHPMFRSSLRRIGLVTPDYARKTPEERARWLGRVLRWAEAVASALPAEEGAGGP